MYGGLWTYIDSIRVHHHDIIIVCCIFPQANEESDEVKALIAESFEQHGFNEYQSSKFALDRAIPDVRITECRDLRSVD